MKSILFLVFLLPLAASAQSLYFPPTVGAWQTMDPAELAWNPDSLAALQQYLDEKNTKGFIILRDGRMVTEWYFDTFTRDSVWYWASAGKTMTATLAGIAQQEGLLDIQQPTSTYLGNGWTACDSSSEDEITVWNHLTMTSGLNDLKGDCTADSCMECLADPGTRWAYHNGAYTQLSYIIEAAAGTPINQYMLSKVMLPMGSIATYLPADENRIVFSTTRAFAKFGLMILAKGNWNGTQLVDSAWVEAMTSPSQSINPSYGYLWWLNGQGSYKLPGVQILFPGDLIPTAPDDMFAALGKNDQKLYVVPSMNMVVARLGNQADGSNFALSDFDDQLWAKIMRLGMANTAVEEGLAASVQISPNPTSHGDISITSPLPIKSWTVRSLSGQLMTSGSGSKAELTSLSPGVYFVEVQLQNGAMAHRRVVKQ